MIGKPEWFKMRKYGGWGLTPATWEGWVYLLVAIIPMAIISTLKLPDQTATMLMIAWALVLIVDVVDIMRKIKKDEREKAHEAIAERNALWFMIATLTAGIAYQAAAGVIKESVEIDPVILIALIGAMVAKAATHFYLRDK